MTATLPPKLHDLTRAALENEWNLAVSHQESTAGAPFVRLRAKREHRDIYASWHTGKTGTYRWYGAVVDNRHSNVTYSRVMEILKEPRP